MTTIEYAYDRFCTERFPLPTEREIVALERRIGVTFSPDYRQFVLEFNGGYFGEPEIAPVSEDCPPALLTLLHGIGASHREAELARSSDLVLFEDNDPPKILPIGATPTGGLIILTTEAEGRGEIFLKQAFGGFYYLADGIEEFFALLRDQPGRQTH
ncbi:MAG: SMI1/KNR4 family protein [Planctomycetia bacterium]|nr:SMI1/KNR4 family protein [Planctomycetia bacterium]